jgi:hypothetical protein
MVITDAEARYDLQLGEPRHEFGVDLFRGVGDRDRTHAAGDAGKKGVAVLGLVDRVDIEHRRETLDEDLLFRPDQNEIGLVARHVVLLDQMKPNGRSPEVADFSDEVMPKNQAAIRSSSRPDAR